MLAQQPECARIGASSPAKRPTRRTINSKNAKSGANNPFFKPKQCSMASFRRCPHRLLDESYTIGTDLTWFGIACSSGANCAPN